MARNHPPVPVIRLTNGQDASPSPLAKNGLPGSAQLVTQLETSSDAQSTQGYPYKDNAPGYFPVPYAPGSDFGSSSANMQAVALSLQHKSPRSFIPTQSWAYTESADILTSLVLQALVAAHWGWTFNTLRVSTQWPLPEVSTIT